MNLLDFMVIILSVLAFLRGIWRGLIREVFSFGGLVLGIYTGAKYSNELKYILSFLNNPVIAQILSFLLIFVFLYVGVNILGFLMRKLIKVVSLGGIDRTVGGVLGLVEGITLSNIVIFVIVLSPWGKVALEESYLAKPLYFLFISLLGEFSMYLK